MTNIKEQTFEEAVAEYIHRSRELIDKEAKEHLPPRLPSPFDQLGPPYQAVLRLNPTTVRNYARSIGDDNPLYTDREYGRHSPYGCQIAPGTVLSLIRYPSVHGAMRPIGYPLAQFISGNAWEFFDAVRVGSQFRSSKVTKEVIEKKGSRGRLVLLISEVTFSDYHGDTVGKCYGTQIAVPMESMGTSRAMKADNMGQKLLYERKVQEYTPEDIEQLFQGLRDQPRRGAEPLYWEDVEVGDELNPLLLPPWTLRDQICSNFMSYCLVSAGGTSVGTDDPSKEPQGDELAFEPSFRMLKNLPGDSRTNPLTRWSWNADVAHDDAILAGYDGQPAPFDHGVQRFQVPQQLFTNWMGDHGFIRRMQIALRKPVYVDDVTRYEGQVANKFIEVQEGETAAGGKPNRAEYHAVGIRYQGLNQSGEAHSQGTATVYLPSRQGGPVQLPIPQPSRPPYVPYETFYRDWY